MVELPEHLRGMFEFAYLTGWRVMSEVRVLKWDQVDFDACTVKLRIRTTKNNEPRTFPFAALPQLHSLLEKQRAYTDEWERQKDTTIPFVFHRHGKPIKDFRHAWQMACQRAGVFGVDGRAKVPHDFRRAAIRNLVRAGVPENTAMRLTGHKTREVFNRYDIVSNADLVDAAGKLATFHGGNEDAQPAAQSDKLGTDWAQSEELIRTA
jgi:integrase